MSLKPRSIRLEATTSCQLKCPSCPTASGEIAERLGRGFLKFEHFKKIVDENSWISNIELSNWGEIFLNKDLFDIIRYAYRKNVQLTACNGSNLNTVRDGILEALVKYKLHAMTCSIDGATPATYSVYRRGGDFDRVISNIKLINEYKRKYKSRYPLLIWQFVAFGHNEHEIDQAMHMAKELDMRFQMKLSWDDLYGTSFSPVKNKDLIREKSGLGVATRTEYEQKHKKQYLYSACLQLWHQPQINFDGNVLGCCVNYWKSFGNALEEGVATVLNNERMNHARGMLMGQKGSRDDISCSTCPVYINMAKKQEWITEKDIQGVYVESRKINMLRNKVLGPRLLARMLKLYASVRSFQR